MLDRTKIIDELSKNLPTLSTTHATDHEVAKTLWQGMSADQTLSETLTKNKQPIPLPTWQGAVGISQSINPINSYDVIAIDGSQIYPDRHEGISCFVINIGTVFFRYRADQSSVTFKSTPYLLSNTSENEFENKQEIVNAMRTEREFIYGLDLMCQQTQSMPRLLLMDGSLVFWHLQVTQSEAKQQFLSRYVQLLEQYYEKKQLFAGFISLPQSRELINIIRTVGHQQTGQLLELGSLVDADIAATYLQEYNRSIIFQNHASVTEQYPEHSKPHFYYFNTGNEIARIELPAWITHNKEYLSMVESIITDQCIKGLGYPISLAEAHEQAVVSAADREFFYATIQGMLNKNVSRSSQKLMKKKKMPI
jgi:hypothetical protein